MTQAHPFGSEITTEEILENFSFFEDWEEKYGYLIDLGKELPPLSNDEKIEEHLIRGCQSQVWILSEWKEDKLYLSADSDAIIVKGLVALVLAAFHGKTAAEIKAFDIQDYFTQLGLLKHLSPLRGNGLRSMVNYILSLV